ncbi:MAG TPA: DUF389 domain-containing protein, partial [Gemmatimonadales bacterium]|nr:DUF389 domain-containing protein [Gemmatimonadales bacterium]
MGRFEDGLRRWAGLAEGTDIEGTVERVAADSSLRGANLWLLACSAVLASIGLDTNSAAVIIGAMLISPLMGPIVGIGLATGIDDRALLNGSLKSFGMAMAIALAASFLYFLATPLGEVTSELQARTSPTLLDVGVAFFGGLAGIVSGSRREQTNAIPGVAIATALMPPLCTAGFGLATGNLRFFAGAFYLFFINAVFISLATFFVVRGLRFPLKRVEPARQRAVTMWVTAFAVLVTLPSAWILYALVREARQQQRVTSFVRQHVAASDRDALRWDVVPSDSGPVLTVLVAGRPMSHIEEDSARAVLGRTRRLDAMGLRVVQTELSPEERRELTTETSAAVLQALEARTRAVPQPRNPLGPLPLDTMAVAQLQREIRALHPELTEVAVGALTAVDSLGRSRTLPTITI